jgi:hypothetical protein
MTTALSRLTHWPFSLVVAASLPPFEWIASKPDRVFDVNVNSSIEQETTDGMRSDPSTEAEALFRGQHDASDGMTREEVNAVEYFLRGVEGEKIRRRLRQKMRVWQDALDEQRGEATSMRAHAADARAGARSRAPCAETQRYHWPLLSSHEAQRCACGRENCELKTNDNTLLQARLENAARRRAAQRARLQPALTGANHCRGA